MRIQFERWENVITEVQWLIDYIEILEYICNKLHNDTLVRFGYGPHGISAVRRINSEQILIWFFYNEYELDIISSRAVCNKCKITEVRTLSPIMLDDIRNTIEFKRQYVSIQNSMTIKILSNYPAIDLEELCAEAFKPSRVFYALSLDPEFEWK